MTRTCWTPSRWTCWPSWPGGSRRSRWRWSSPAATRRTSARRWRGSRRCASPGSTRSTRSGCCSSSLPEPIDPAAAAQIAAATGGNPLALIDLASELSVRAADRVQLRRRADARSGATSRRTTCARSATSSRDVQLWLLVAAADSTGNIDLIGAAARDLGLPGEPGRRGRGGRPGRARRAPSGSATRWCVRRPTTPPRERTGGGSTGAVGRPPIEMGLVELEAWHAAKATLGTDPAVADRLERVADLAGRRGGFASRASVLAQASALTPHGPLKYARLVAAAEAALGRGCGPVGQDAARRGRRGRPRPGLPRTADRRARQPGDVHRRPAADARRAPTCSPPRSRFHGHDADARAGRPDQGVRVHAARRASGRRAPPWPSSGTAAQGRRAQRRHRPRPSCAALSAHILLPYAQAVPVMRAAVDAIGELDARELLQYGADQRGADHRPVGRRRAARRASSAPRRPRATPVRCSCSTPRCGSCRWPSSAAAPRARAAVHRAGARAAARDRLRRRARHQRRPAGLVRGARDRRSR